MDNSSFAPISGTIQNLAPMPQDCCSQLMSMRTSQGIVQFVVASDTYVVDNVRLRPGIRVTAFYDVNLPVPLIYPPRYHASLVTVITPRETVTMAYFNRNLVAEDNSLQLNIAPSTEVVTTNGQSFRCRLGGRLLVVFYSSTTRSIPPQTTPRRVIVFC